MNAALRSLIRIVDRIIVITIPSATERQAHIAALMDRHSLPFEFHFGRDCRNTSVNDLTELGEYDPVARLESGRPGLTAGEIGCALSHRDVAKKIAHGNDERVLILEDDVCVIETNLGHFEKSANTAPPGWKLAYFGYEAMNLKIPYAIRVKLLTYYPLRHLFGSDKHDPRTIRRIYRRPLNSHWMKAGSFNNAHAYAIDRSAAAYLANSQAVISMESDISLNQFVRFSGLQSICLKYPVFGQRPDIASTIGARPSWQ